MLTEIVTYALYALAVFLFFRYIVNINVSIFTNEAYETYKADQATKNQPVKTECQTVVELLEKEKERRRFEKQETCERFCNTVSDLLGEYFNLEQIARDLKSIKEKLLSEKQPLLSHQEIWEMFEMMGTIEKMYALLQESFRTRSRKKKSELVDQFYVLKDTLKEYKLPYKYGDWAIEQARLEACSTSFEEGYERREEEREEEDNRSKDNPASASWKLSSNDPDVARIIDKMFQQSHANASTISPA